MNLFFYSAYGNMNNKKESEGKLTIIKPDQDFVANPPKG